MICAECGNTLNHDEEAAMRITLMNMSHNLKISQEDICKEWNLPICIGCSVIWLAKNPRASFFN